MLGIAAILIVLLSLTAVAFAAVPPLKSSEPAGTDGYSTYIVAFKDQQGMSSVAEDKVTSLVNSYNGRIVYKYSIINGMAVTIPDSKVDQLKAMDNVKYVEKDQQVHVLLDKAVPQIGADQVWASGYTGKGVKVAVIDTGIDGSHPDLNGSKVVGWVDYTQGKTTPYDDHGHGTHVSSTIAGTGAASNGQYKGVAPEASLMGIKVLGKDGSGSNTNILKGIDWAVQNHADVISMSLGSSTHSQASDDAIKKAVDAGVIVVVAAGNSGPSAKTVACPGDSPDAITVGAVDRNDQIASFSSRGPTSDGRTKPDVTNMGVGLVAAKATGVAASKPVGQYYQAMSGTSMATPMTSGVVALLLQAKPGMNQQQVKDALTKTAKQLGSGTPNNDYGYGRVQTKAALDYVLSGQVPAPTPTPTPTPGPSPTPTPTPGPGPTPTPTPTPTPGGSYAVGMITMFAQYNGQVGSLDRFQVTPGTTATQSAMIINTGSAADSYTVSVNGIPAEWYSISGYNGGTVSPQAGASMKVALKPAADAAAGAYRFTVTATSNADSTVSSSKAFTLNVGAGRTTPTPTAVPGPNPTSTPVPTPVPEPGTGLTGTVSNGGDYYAYITPTQAGEINAKIAWQGNYNNLDMYLYSPEGKLVAQSQQRYTNSEAIQYSAPSDGYYLLRVHAQQAMQTVTFTGTATPAVAPAYKKAGSVAAGQSVSYSFTPGDASDINARLIWNWGFNSLTLSLYDQNGNKVTSSTPSQNTMTGQFAQIDYPYPAPGTYTLQVDGTKVSGKANYVLISPYQL